MTRMPMEEYEEAFDRRNLHTHDGDSVPEGAHVVLLGEGVRAHFGIPKLLIFPQVVRGVTWRQIPHPSGRCLFYNDVVLREVVGQLLRSIT